MATDFTSSLQAIETRAEHAIVQELRIMTRELLALPSLPMQDRAYADGLLLKLDRLIDSQQMQAEDGCSALVPQLLMTAQLAPDDTTAIAAVLD